MSSLPDRAGRARPVADSAVPHHLLCNSCSQPLFNGFQTPHGCRLCQSCVTNLLHANERRPCPGNTEACRDQQEEIEVSQATCFADMATRREVARLRVLCPNWNAGCTQQLTWAQVDAHMDSCHFLTVACNLCNLHMMKKQLQHHVTNECEQRKVTCNLCSQLVTVSDMQSKHNNLQSDVCCSVFSDHCPHCGDLSSRKMDRGGYVSHLLECRESPVACKYSHVGCCARVRRSDIEEHYRTCCDSHLEMIDVKLRQIGTVPRPNIVASEARSDRELLEVKRKVECLQEYFRKMQVNVANWAQTMLDFEQLASRYGGIAQMQTALKQMPDRVGRLEQLAQERPRQQPEPAREATGSALESDSSSGSPTDPSMASETSQLQKYLRKVERKLRTLESTSYDGCLSWRIENLSGIRQLRTPGKKENSAVSPRFFLRRFGPMFVARLFLDGNKSGSGSHLSVEVVNVKQQLDDIQDWPIIADVTFRLICIADRRNDIVKTVRMDTSGASRPRTKEDFEVSAGEPMLIPQREFDSRFTKQDSCFLEVEIADLTSHGSSRRKGNARRN